MNRYSTNSAVFTRLTLTKLPESGGLHWVSVG